MTRDEIIEWLRAADIGDVAYIHGAALQLLAMDQGITEAELYAYFAERAANDPDANVVRLKFLDGHTEVSNRETEAE